MALATRGLAYGDSTCPMCGVADETADHLLANCMITNAVCWMVCVWDKSRCPAALKL
ncbi:hypothetical protein HanOQP8_Chr16g0619151 [Helianthus annuus]|nr:hypothetical protein HanLR1_Chr16g0623391 [Helianthus annuus]KAJ0645026.1 hypothetical protein HanOQP8_Chr16g0619151 [Helianthus annuus]